MRMPVHPDIPFTEGSTVKVIDCDDTRNSSNYSYLIGHEGVITNPCAGSQPGNEDAIIEVRFGDGHLQWMFHWRLEVISKQITWEV